MYPFFFFCLIAFQPGLMWFSLISWDSFLFFSLLLPWNNTTVLYLHCYCALFSLLFLCEKKCSLPFFVLKTFYIASLLHCNFFSPKEKKKKYEQTEKERSLELCRFQRNDQPYQHDVWITFIKWAYVYYTFRFWNFFHVLKFNFSSMEWLFFNCESYSTVEDR